MNDLPDYDLAKGLVEGARCRPLSSGGRRSRGCWEVEGRDGTKRVIKISKFDQDVLAINQQLISGGIAQLSRHYSLPQIEQLRIDKHSILAIYTYVPHKSLQWADLRTPTQARRLALAAADFNTRNSNAETMTYLPKKKFTLGLTPKKLQQIFPQESEEFCRKTADDARRLYEALRAKAADSHAFENLGLAHNDLVPLNIGIPINLCQEDSLSPMEQKKGSPSRAAGTGSNQAAARRKLILLDLDNAIVSPLGSDLRFILLAVSGQANAIEYINHMAVAYHSLAMRTHPEASIQAITASAILGYADAWLNLHRRTRSRLDRERLDRCLDFCRSALKQQTLA